LQDLDPGLKTLSTDARWKVFMFIGYEMPVPPALQRCPKTAALLRKIPGLTTALFSVLRGPKNIPPHRGPFNGVLRYHLPLIVPPPVDGAVSNACHIRVGKTTRSWVEGQSMIFDDTNYHEVVNDRPGERVVLFVDFYRPVPPPFCWINRAMMWATRHLPFCRVAIELLKRWNTDFELAEQRPPSARTAPVTAPK
jgi:beta-hydroxylase